MASDPGQPMVIIPAFNEAESLPRVLAALREMAAGYRVVVIDDGSTDATADIASRAGARVLRHPFNLGYGAALQTGYKYALAMGASRLAQMDADAQHDPAELPRLLAALESDGLDLVIGSRFLAGGGYSMSIPRSIGRRFFQAAARLFGLRVSDPTSGMQAMNRRVVELYARDFFPADYPDVDVLIEAHRHGVRIGEIPVAMRAATRQSSLHHGFTPFYYVFKMLLSIWATTLRKRTTEADS